MSETEGKPRLSVTISQPVLDEIDRMKGGLSKSTVVEILLARGIRAVKESGFLLEMEGSR